MKKMTIQKYILALLSLLLISFSLQTQAEETPPLYQVELIVFETTALRGWTEEYWPREDPLSLDDLQPKKDLPKQFYMLKTEARKMIPSKGYHIIYHQAWYLRGLPENKATPILIENFPKNNYQTQLKGRLFFYKSHYNHVDLQLQIDKYIPKKIRAKFAQHEEIKLEDLPDTWYFTLQESRKLRPGQLHYLDHPIFGALIKIKYLPDR